MGVLSSLFLKRSSGRSISRILSSGFLRLCSHLSGRYVAVPFGAAYPELAPSTVGWRTCGDEQPPIVHRRFRSCLALLPAGVTWPSTLLQMPVVFYTTFSPSPLHHTVREAVCFCGPFRQVNASRRFPRPGCYPTPCSMECGLSSTP